ncbi:MAG: hypothetical protein P8Z30_11975 [Acidobacteriota bacterium]
MGKIFINDNQIQEWVQTAEGISEDFGTDKALGYLIGEKFYRLVSILHDARKQVDKEEAAEAEKLLLEFTALTKDAFESHQIREYFQSHPRLGVHGHIASEEQHAFLVEQGAIEHSIDTELRDALIFGDMLKYFGISA